MHPETPPRSDRRGLTASGVVVTIAAVFALVAAACSDTSTGRAEPGDRLPGEAWVQSTPSRAGLDIDAVEEILTGMEASDADVHRIIAVRDGLLGLDANIWPSPTRGPHELGAVTTSVVALVVAAAIEAGDIGSFDDRLGDHLDLPPGSASASLTFRNILDMRTGLACEGQLAPMLGSLDMVEFAAGIERQRPAGGPFAYCAPALHLLAAAIAQSTGSSLADYADQVLFDPLDIDSWLWADDEQGVTHGWSGLDMDPEDLARIGQLVLDDGIVNRRRVLPEGFLADARSGAVRVDAGMGYGLGWWVPEPGRGETLEAMGRGGQTLHVDRAQRTIVAVVGAGAEGVDIARTLATPTVIPPVPDLTADRAIGERLRRLARRPDEVPPTFPEPGARTETVIRLAPNNRDVVSMYAGTDEDRPVDIQLQRDIETAYLRIPVTGVPTIAQRSFTDRPAAVFGSWDGTVFSIDHEEVLGGGHLHIAMELGEQGALRITDLTSDQPPMVARES